MTNDPVQALIEAGAIPSSPFGPDSRYAGIGFALHRDTPDEPGTAYVLRRFIPPRRDIAVMFAHVVGAGERADLLSARVFGTPELYWRIADANAVIDPFELTDTLAARIAIPAAPGS